MVKVSDLGYVSSNLQDLPSKEEEKENALRRALANLTSPTPPERLTRTSLPESLLNLVGD